MKELVAGGVRIVSLDELPDIMSQLIREPISPEEIARRRRLSAAARKIRDEMLPLEDDVKDIIRRQRGDAKGLGDG